MYCNYIFIATLAIKALIIEFTGYLVIVFALKFSSFCVLEVHFGQSYKYIIFTTNFNNFYLKIPVKWSKSQIKKKS